MILKRNKIHGLCIFFYPLGGFSGIKSNAEEGGREIEGGIKRQIEREISLPHNFCALQNGSKTFFLVLHHDDVAVFQ